MQKKLKIKITSLLLVFIITLNIIVLPKKTHAFGLTPTIGFFITCMVSAVGYAVFTDQEAIQKVNIDLFEYLKEAGHKVGDIAKTAQAYVLLKLTNELTMPVTSFNNKIKGISNTIKKYFLENEKEIKANINKGWTPYYYYDGTEFKVKAKSIENFEGWPALQQMYNTKGKGDVKPYIPGLAGGYPYFAYNNKKILYGSYSGEHTSYVSGFPKSPTDKGYKLDYHCKKLRIHINDSKITVYNLHATVYHYAYHHNITQALTKPTIYNVNYLLDGLTDIKQYISDKHTRSTFLEGRGIFAYNLSYSLTPTEDNTSTSITTPKRDLAMPKLPDNIQNTNVQDLDKLMAQLYNDRQYMENLVKQQNTVALPNALLKNEIIVVNPDIADITNANRENSIGITEQGLNNEDLLEYLTNNPVIVGSINSTINKAIAEEIAGVKEEQERAFGLLNTLQADVLANTQAITSTGEQVTTLSDTFTSTIADIKDFFNPETKIKLDLDYLKNITLPNKFPFCLPFDFVNIVKSMQANGKAPKFTIVIKTYKKDIDFQDFDYFAKISRSFLYIIFLVGMTYNTKKLLGDR